MGSEASLRFRVVKVCGVCVCVQPWTSMTIEQAMARYECKTQV